MSRRIVPLLTLCGLLALAWYSVLLARADLAFRENNLEALRTAVRLAPSNADYHALLAEHLEAAGSNPDTELENATNLSPHESRYWIRRAFRAEVERKYDECEQYLLEAYRVDHGFDPRWALMNYYFRRGNFAEFWTTTRLTLDMSYGSLDPIFRLCLAANDDPSVTRRILPPRREILSAFFIYLFQHEPVEYASSVASELAPGAEPEEVPWLVAYCDKQMGHNNGSSLLVWNALCRRRMVPFQELAPERGQIVTNGDFSAVPLKQGFDWKYGPVEGIAVGPMDAAQGISINISGKQADIAPIVEQEIPLTPGKQYVLRYEYRLLDTQRDSGVQWMVRETVAGDTAGSDPLATSSVLSGTDWSSGQLAFSAGRHDAARLILQYKRAPGTVRWKGTVQVRRVSSGLAEADLAVPGLAR
jgi:hypothetical protein